MMTDEYITIVREVLDLIVLLGSLLWLFSIEVRLARSEVS